MEEVIERRLELQKVKKELQRHRGKGKKAEKTMVKGENRKMREKLERIIAARIKKEEDIEENESQMKELLK